MSRGRLAAVLERFRTLVDDYPMQPLTEQTASAHLRVFGLYLVVCAVLIFNRYFPMVVGPSHLFGDIVETDGLDHYWSRMWWAASVTLAYIVPPYLYCRFVMKIRLREMGVSLTGLRGHLPVYFLLFMGVLPFVAVASLTGPFLEQYPINEDAGLSLRLFILWELLYALQFLGLEFFFRGVMLQPTARILGVWSVVVMVIPYTMLHLRKPFLECSGAVIAGLLLGYLALRARSIWGGVMLHVGVAWTMDVLAILRKGGFGGG